MLRIELTHVDDEEIRLRLNGRLVIGSDTERLRANLAAFIQEGHRIVTADLAGVTRIDSTGVGTLIGLRSLAQSRGCSFSVLSISKSVRDLLLQVKLLTVFGIDEVAPSARTATCA